MAGPIEVREAESPRERRQFIRFPWTLYGSDPFWVPPLIRSVKRALDPQRDPFFDHAEMRLFLAWRDGEIVGRIASIVNYLHNNYHVDKMGFWGFFETAPDPDVARALLDAAADELRAHGLDEMSGPFNPSINAECGMLVDGFNLPPVALMPYNPAYYPDLVEAAGHTKLKDLYAYLVVDEQVGADRKTRQRLDRIAQRVRQRHPDITVRPLDMSVYEEEVGRLGDLFNAARRDNWGFVPTTDEEIRQMAADMKPILIPELVLVAERRGKPIGCMMSIPDINPLLKKCNGRLFPFGWFHLLMGRRTIHRMRIFGAAVHPEHRNLGVIPLLFVHYVEAGLRLGMDVGELSWVCEDNTQSIRTLEAAFKPNLYKRYRIYHHRLVD
ncbi:GNAT family N-acetyltransferase [bacterium]|nr:GNAT family N-acetyltransferase [bacterium]